MEIIKKKKKIRDRRQEESEMKRGRRRMWREGRRGNKPKEQEAEEHEGASRVEQWPKIAGQNQRGIKGIARGGGLR